MLRAITPIVIPLELGLGLGDIVAPEASVAFDLDGSGRSDRRWGWIRPSAAGWLVHDPRRTGKISSGIQMFGSRTFMMFFKYGYEALSLLDDDGDGEIRGDELAGLALWVDADSDGVSDAGEVIPLEDRGIVALSCSAEAIAGGWVSQGGVAYADGGAGDSYDVVLDGE